MLNLHNVLVHQEMVRLHQEDAQRAYETLVTVGNQKLDDSQVESFQKEFEDTEKYIEAIKAEISSKSL